MSFARDQSLIHCFLDYYAELDGRNYAMMRATMPCRYCRAPELISPLRAEGAEMPIGACREAAAGALRIMPRGGADLMPPHTLTAN